MANFIKAIYVARKQDGKPDKWARAQVNLVGRSEGTFLEGNGHTPGRALKFESADGEVYDEILFLQSWPTTWPIIGKVD